MHYVGLDSVKLAKQRIANKVVSGGQGISDKDVERRYEESLKNLITIITLCDLVALYDNTEQFRQFVIFKHGKMIRLSKIFLVGILINLYKFRIFTTAVKS